MSRAVASKGDSQIRCFLWFSLLDVFCIPLLWGQSDASFPYKLSPVNGCHILLWWPLNPSSFTVVGDSWIVTYAHMVPHLLVLRARDSSCSSEQHFLDTPCTWKSPFLLHWEPEPQPNVRPWMSRFPLWYRSTGHKHYLWAWRYLPSHATMLWCFHFTARLSPLILLIQMLLFMLLREGSISDMNQ